MAGLIVIAQWLMEKYHLRPKNYYNKEKFNLKEEITRWIKLFIIFGIIAILLISSHNIFFLAPPLIVTFAEFANENSPLRKKIMESLFYNDFCSNRGKYVATDF